jgi:cell division protein FtsW (lipid II flippase)
MKELVKALKNFIVRDIIYIIGGAIVIISFLYLHNRMDFLLKHANDDHTAVCLLLLGIAYAVGYCFQDTASWIGIVTTASYFRPWGILQWVYWRFEHRFWQNIFPDIPQPDEVR